MKLFTAVTTTVYVLWIKSEDDIHDIDNNIVAKTGVDYFESRLRHLDAIETVVANKHPILS